VLLTASAIGGVEPWTSWQFVGLFGVVETASGAANVITPNVWRLPIAELETRTDVRLAASALLLPHWGGLARCAAGLVFIAVAGWEAGVGLASVALVPFVLALAWWTLALSILLARVGVAWPEVDVVQFVVRWGTREKELAPLSIGASVLQFLLSIVTLPVAKLFAPSLLYQPELGPSGPALFAAVAASIALLVLVALAWYGRIELNAPAEQQREAEARS
jgi:hypothetical protein